MLSLSSRIRIDSTFGQKTPVLLLMRQNEWLREYLGNWTYQVIVQHKRKVLESVVTEHDLGVFASNDLTLSKEVFEQSCGANELLGYIRSNTAFIRSTDSRRSVYLTLVRPLFGYAYPNLGSLV